MSDTSLPSHWATCLTSDVATLVRGVTYGKQDARKSEAKRFRPILRANNINGTINFDDLVFLPTHLISPAQQLRAGDILFAMSSGSRHLVGKSARINRDLDIGFGAFCGVLRPCDEVSDGYLFHIYQTRDFRRAVSEVSKGSNINNLKREHLLDYEIPLPPLAEQRRIVAKIEELFSELDAGEDSLRRARRQLGVYRQSLLKQAFEGKLTESWRKQNPAFLESPEQLLKRIQAERQERYNQRLKEWEQGKKKKKAVKPRKLKPLASVTDELRGSLPEPPGSWDWVHIDSYAAPEPNAIKAGPFGSALKKQDYVPEGYKIYGQEQVISGDPYFGDYFISRHKYESLENCAIQPRDILISLVGTVGKVLVLPQDAAPGIINPRLVKITPSSFLDPDFFKAYFESAFLKSLYKLETHGATMDVLNLGIIQALPFPLCTLPEQHEIVRLLDEQFTVIEQNEREIDAALKRSAALRQSILKKAFTGQLVPQDPTDEPASALLERIRKERETSNKAPKKKAAPKRTARHG